MGCIFFFVSVYYYSKQTIAYFAKCDCEYLHIVCMHMLVCLSQSFRTYALSCSQMRSWRSWRYWSYWLLSDLLGLALNSKFTQLTWIGVRLQSSPTLRSTSTSEISLFHSIILQYVRCFILVRFASRAILSENILCFKCKKFDYTSFLHLLWMRFVSLLLEGNKNKISEKWKCLTTGNFVLLWLLCIIYKLKSVIRQF